MHSFITGVDHNHEWMLSWWFDNLRKYNKKAHVTICDFGICSREIKEWARINSDHFIEYEPHPKCAWFYKTKSLLDSPYEKTCWLDSDCEVLENIEDIFDYAGKDQIGLTKDIPRRDGEWWATGVVVVEGNPTILKGWDKIAEKAHLRGDQEAFRSLLEKLPSLESNITEIPNEYQWLRLQLAKGIDSKNKKVIHWTGPKGKEIIRNKILHGSVR